MKKLVIISALILTLIMCIAFIAAIEAVTVTNPDLDAASLSLSLFKKPGPTGYAVDDSGNTIATVTVKAGEEVGRVNEYFYGVNLNPYYLTNNNYNFARSSLLNLNTNFIRMDMKFNSYSTGEGNYDSIEMAKKQELLDWAKSNNLKVLWIAHEMPNWLANTEGGCTVNKTCPPTNYTKWGILVTDFLKEVGCDANTCEVEVWNEPDAQYFWLNNLTTTNPIRSIEYNKLYNATYLAVKSSFPTMQVGGPSTQQLDSGTYLILTNWMGNFSNQIDFVSHHDYLDVSSSVKFYDDSLNNVYSWIYANITDLGVNTSRVLIDEYNILNDAVRLANGKNWSMQLGLAYEETLNSYPDNVSMIEYHFTEDEVNQFQMFNYTNNFFFASYNVTKNFAHYHAGGNIIVNSSSNNNSIKSVASLNPQGIWHITVINTATNNINVNIDLSSTGVEAIKDLSNDKIYPVSNGIANVGVLTEYDVKHYEGIADYEVEKEVVTSVGGYSVGKNKIVSVENLNIAYNEFTAIETDTSVVIPTSEIFVDTNTNSKKKGYKEEEFYGPIQSEEDINEINDKSRTESLFLAVSNNSYLIILIILLGSIICISLIISIIYKKKKREADNVKRLMDWVDKARALGYSNDKMKEMLAQYNWDKNLVEKALK